MPVKACDCFIPQPPRRGTRTVGWEKRMPDFLQVMLIEKTTKNTYCLKTQTFFLIQTI